MAETLPDHRYISTSCLHALLDGREDLHEYCQSDIGAAEQPKMPGTCKFCDSRCKCPCHPIARKEDT